MAAPEFFFSLEVSSLPAEDDLLSDVIAGVLVRAGCRDDARALAAAVRSAVAVAATEGDPPCGVQFSVRDGALEIVVSPGSGRVWRTTRAIP